MTVVRVSEAWQLAGVHLVRWTVSVEGEGIPAAAEFDERFGPPPRYLLALDGDRPVGTLRLATPDATTAKIERVAVVADRRGRGVGRRLVTAAEAWARDLGARLVVVDSRAEAAGFYEAATYRRRDDVRLASGRFPLVRLDKDVGEQAERRPVEP